MEFFVEKDLKGPESVVRHSLYGKAVFVECGIHDPENFCYDHHSMTGSDEFTLASAGMVQQELLKRRKMPGVIVMNHVRHLDNLMALYLLWFRGLATHPDTTRLVSVADLIDRVGPLAVASLPQMERSILETAQNKIPFKEWEIENEELQGLAISAIESIRSNVTAPVQMARYEVIWTSDDEKFIVVESNMPIGMTLYDQGYDAYGVYTKNEDGTYKWTLARASEYVPFNIPVAARKLNELEGCEVGKGWGGRPVIGGSPQGVGTKLSPEEVMNVIRSFWQ